MIKYIDEEERFKTILKNSLAPFSISQIKRYEGRWYAEARMMYPLEAKTFKWVPVSELLNMVR